MSKLSRISINYDDGNISYCYSHLEDSRYSLSYNLIHITLIICIKYEHEGVRDVHSLILTQTISTNLSEIPTTVDFFLLHELGIFEETEDFS